MLRRRAGTVSLAALAVVLSDRSAAKVTDIDEFGVELGALLFEIGKQGRHHRKASYQCLVVATTTRLAASTLNSGDTYVRVAHPTARAGVRLP
jgi:hypothetical protein